MSREAISKKTRFEVFKRDQFTCQYCGGTPPKVVLEVDHIIAVASDGTNDEDNLVTSCFDCNRGKGARSLSSVPASLHERTKLMQEQDDQIAAYGALMVERRERRERDAWLVVEALFGAPEIGENWFKSIEMFLGKLPVHEVIDAAEIAYSSNRRNERLTFLYFCGVCWRKIKGDQQCQ